MAEPIGSRPYMPGYGTLDADQGTGLLPWSWARERLERSHDYWVATTRPDGRPHIMPVWGVFLDEALWFSSSRGSRKARNIATNPHCAITTDNAYEPVIIEGTAELIADQAAITTFVIAINDKYHTEYSVDFFNAPENACFVVRPTWAFGLTESDFTGSPTRWVFALDRRAAPS
ncbi:MAG TPA: pyridoxamine 5'-phosphate oxidase family protein [Candidatus Dormibacteraeota bacterium]